MSWCCTVAKNNAKRYQYIIYKILLPRLALFLETNCIGSLEPIEIRTIMNPSTPILLIRDCQVDPTCRLFFMTQSVVSHLVIVVPRYVPSNLLCVEALSLSNATSLFCLIRCLTLGDKADVRGAAKNPKAINFISM